MPERQSSSSDETVRPVDSAERVDAPSRPGTGASRPGPVNGDPKAIDRPAAAGGSNGSDRNVAPNGRSPAVAGRDASAAASGSAATNGGAVPGSAVPESTVPTTAAPETAAPETAAPETAALKTAAPETTVLPTTPPRSNDRPGSGPAPGARPEPAQQGVAGPDQHPRSGNGAAGPEQHQSPAAPPSAAAPPAGVAAGTTRPIDRAATAPEPVGRPAGRPADQPTDENPMVRTPAAAPAPAVDGSEQPTVAVPAVAGAMLGNGTPDGETTQTILRPEATEAAPGTLTEKLAVAPATPPQGDTDATGPTGGERPSRRRRLLLAAAAVAALLAVLYGGDLALGAGKVPRGVLVAGVPVGGLSLADAERQLRGQIEPRAARPVAVTAGEARSELDPKAAGLSVDWPATLDRAGSQPLNPITRITSFFTEREVGVSTASNQEALDSALASLGSIVDRAPAEGAVRFEGTTPIPVDPVPGQALDVPAAESVLEREWVLGKPVALPLTVLPPITDAQDVATAIEQVARPAVSAPVVVTGEQDVQGTLSPEAIAGLLTFRADPGGLVPEINLQGAAETLDPQLAASETPGRDAALDFSSGRPVVTPSKDGRGVDYEATLKDLLTVLTGTGERKITAIYADQPAELTTDELNKLGITGVIGEFTTRGFAPDSGKNIRRAAQMINGKIVEPGATFSLNNATEPRNASNGFVEAGIISDGHASRGVGGGVSQVATTLYNAAYFAGMVDVAHKEHSFYISRYPPGREATVFGDAIDMKFRNDNPTGVMIQTAWTPQSITVRLFGTKRYEVSSTPGPRTNPTKPEKVSIPDGEPCAKSNGAPGFTVTDTRTLREISTGQVRRETRTVRYNPSPIVECDDDD